MVAGFHLQYTHTWEWCNSSIFFFLQNYLAGVVLNCIFLLFQAPNSLFMSHEKVITYLSSWIPSQGSICYNLLMEYLQNSCSEKLYLSNRCQWDWIWIKQKQRRDEALPVCKCRILIIYQQHRGYSEKRNGSGSKLIVAPLKHIHTHTHSSFEALAVSTIQHIRASGCVIHTHLKQCVLLISALLTRWLRLDLKRKKYSKKIERLRSWMLVNSHCALQSNSIRFNFTYILPNHINNVVYIL